MDFVTIWFISGLIIFGLSVFAAGLFGNKYDRYADRAEIVFGGAILGVGWPLVIIAILGAAPFIGIYYLGKFLSKKDR